VFSLEAIMPITHSTLVAQLSICGCYKDVATSFLVTFDLGLVIEPIYTLVLFH
jgi:hypothetical protein